LYVWIDVLNQEQSSRANRKDVIAEANRSHVSAKEIARLERKKAQAIALGQKAEAAEAGEDLERKRAWQYSIEDNERWDKKLKQKASRGNHEFTGLLITTVLYSHILRLPSQHD
jgi:pre-mRNA-splicing factor SYF2